MTRFSSQPAPFWHTVQNLSILRGENYSAQMSLPTSPSWSLNLMVGQTTEPHMPLFKHATHSCLFNWILTCLSPVEQHQVNSWDKPAERVNSLLNLGLRGTALATLTPGRRWKNQMRSTWRRVATMTSLSERATKQPDLKEAFEKRVHPVAALVIGRFERLERNTHRSTSAHNTGRNCQNSTIQHHWYRSWHDAWPQRKRPRQGTVQQAIPGQSFQDVLHICQKNNLRTEGLCLIQHWQWTNVSTRHVTICTAWTPLKRIFLLWHQI